MIELNRWLLVWFLVLVQYDECRILAYIQVIKENLYDRVFSKLIYPIFFFSFVIVVMRKDCIQQTEAKILMKYVIGSGVLLTIFAYDIKSLPPSFLFKYQRKISLIFYRNV